MDVGWWMVDVCGERWEVTGGLSEVDGGWQMVCGRFWKVGGGW